MQFLRKTAEHVCPKGWRLAIGSLCVCVAIFILCGDAEASSPKEVPAMETAESGHEITKADNMVVWNEPEYVDFTDVAGSYIIKDGGEYVLSGQSKDTLLIDAEDQIVHLYFDNLQIEARSGAAIYVKSAGKVIVTLLDGTDNVLKDSPAKRIGKEEKAAFYSAADLTVNGTGKLSVYGYYEDGIRTRDVLKILGGEISLWTKGDGIRGNDGVCLMQSKVKIESEGNGVVSANSGKRNKGTIVVEKENLSVISGKYAISCADNLYIKESKIFMNSVFGDMKVNGEIFEEEGNDTNE